MYKDYFLKFDSKEEAQAVLYTPTEQKNYESVPVPGEFQTVYIYSTPHGSEYTSSRMLTDDDLFPVETDESDEEEQFDNSGWAEGYVFLREEQEQVMQNVEIAPTTLYIPKFLAIDEIGVIYKPTGKMLEDSEGMEFPEMAPIEGWHVNVRLPEDESAEALEDFRVYPETPNRMWA